MRSVRGQPDRLETCTAPGGAARPHCSAIYAAPPEGGWAGFRNCGLHGSDSSHRISSPHRPFPLRDLWGPKKLSPTGSRPAPARAARLGRILRHLMPRPPEGGWAGLHNCGLHGSDSSHRSSSAHRPFPLRDLWDPKESTPTSLRPAPPPAARLGRILRHLMPRPLRAGGRASAIAAAVTRATAFQA